MSDVLRRKMFAVSMTPEKDAMNVGIMSGFSEPEESEYEGPEMEEGESGEEGEDMYEDRRPDNLEIIANNLRGDYKSLDNRYAELALKVGEEVAAQTPPEVIALMQPQMAQQMQGGIAGLPQGQQMMPGATGAPPMPAAMPPGPPAMDQGPMPQMAKGGFIQKHALGMLAQAGRIAQPLMNMGRAGMSAVTNYGLPFTLGATGMAVGQTTLNAMNKQVPGAQGKTWGERTGLMNPFPQMVQAPSAVPIYASGEPTDPEAALVQGAFSDSRLVPALGMPTPGAAVPGAPGAPAPNAAQGLIVPGVTPESNVPKLPSITDVIASSDTSAGDTSTVVPSVAGAVAKAAPEEKGLKERTAERAAIYKDIIGDDKDAMQSQALLAIADFGLRLAGAKGRSIGERISKAAEALPGTLMKITEKAGDTDKAIKLAALKATEEEMASESKLASAYAIARLKQSQNPGNARIGAIASMLATTPALSGLDETSLINIARLYDNNKDTIKTDEVTGEVTLNLPGRAPFTLSPATVATSDTLSYVKADDPIIESKEQFTKLRDPEERKKITAKMGKRERLLSDLNQAMRTFEKDAFGVVGGTKSIYNFVAPIIPFATGSEDQARAEAAAANLSQKIKSIFGSESGRQLKAEYKDAERLDAIKPGSFFEGYELNMAAANELRRNLLQDISRDRAQLTGGQAYTIRQLPTGLSVDSPLTPTFGSEITRIASVNPSMLIYFQPSPNAAAIQLPVSQAMSIMETAKAKATENRAQGMRF